MVLVASPVFARHVTPPGHPERVERAHVLEGVADSVVRCAAATRSRRGRRPTKSSCACTRRRTSNAWRQPPVRRSCWIRTRSRRRIRTMSRGSPRARRCRRRSTRFASANPRLRSVRPPGHHAEPIERWASASSTTWRLRPRRCSRAVSSAWRSSISTCITATGRRRCSTTSRECCTSRRTSFRSTREQAQPTRLAQVRAAASPSTSRWRPGATDADYALVHREIVTPVLEEFRPELVLVSAGFDAHERDPLASMRMTTEGYAAIVAQLRDVAAQPWRARARH